VTPLPQQAGHRKMVGLFFSPRRIKAGRRGMLSGGAAHLPIRYKIVLDFAGEWCYFYIVS